MNRVVKSICMVLLSAVMWVTGEMQVSAEETCRVMIDLFDIDGIYAEDIEVTFTDTVSGEAYSTVMSHGTSWGVGEQHEIALPAGREYMVTLVYPQSDIIAIVYRENHVDVGYDPIATSDAEVTLEWLLAYIDIFGKHYNDGPSVVGSVASQTMPQKNPWIIDTGNVEADEVINKFYAATEEMRQSDAWDGSLNLYEMNLRADRADFVTYTGNSADEYTAMSKYQRFVMFETYVHPQMMLSESMDRYDFYFGSEEMFLENYVNKAAGIVMSGAPKVLKDAYEEILLWQYQYILEHGCCYDFIHGRSYADVLAGAAEQKQPEQNEEEMQVSVTEYVSLNDEVPNQSVSMEKSESSTEVVRLEEEDTHQAVEPEKKFVVNGDICVVIIVVIGILSFLVYRKKKEQK